MAKRALLRFRNLDLSRDLNDRFTKLFKPGVFDGGEIQVVPLQLKVDLKPYRLMSADGMVVIETSDTFRLDTPDGQTTVIAVRAIYKDNDVPDVEEVAYELTAFNLLPDVGKHVVIAHVSPPLAAVEVTTADIDLKYQDKIDPVGRNAFRGVVASGGLLPAQNNVLGDYYMVVDGIGGVPNIHGWNGFQWSVLTDFVALSTDLLNHRNNLFSNEKHLTDGEKLAVVGTSGTAVGAANKLVDNADTRIPTQGENDALVGSHGSPGTSNKYLTQAFPLAVAEEKSFLTAPVDPYAAIISTEGPVYVGKSGTGSANAHFKFFDLTTANQREYLTSAGVKITVAGIYLDNTLLSELNPATDPNVDSDGFFSGSTLYVKFSTSPDSGFRLIYDKRYTMGTYPVDALSRRFHDAGQTNADTLIAIEKIKGRSFDTVPPTNEQNIELRKDIVDIKEYVSAVFKTDHVVTDFKNVEGVPDFSGDFIPNVGIPANYTFENTGLVSFSYAATTGTVTYGSVLALGSVVPGNVFIDGNSDEYAVVSTNGTNQIVILKRNGNIPLSIDTTVTTSAHGAVKPDNNPRKINLADMSYIQGRDRISIREIEPVFNEYHPATGNVAYQIRKPLISPFNPEARVRLYGGFVNDGSGTKARVVASSAGRIFVTGFFTELHLLVDLMVASPTVTIKVDGDTVGSTIDLSSGGKVADLGSTSEIQQQSIIIATGLDGDKPHTVEVVVNNATDNFIIYGFDLFRTNMTDTIILPGRTFVQADLYKSDAIVTMVSAAVASATRGAVSKRYVNRSLAQQTLTYQMTDMDGTASTPAGTAISATPNFTVTSGLTKFADFIAGDVVKLITATAEEIKVIDSIGPGLGQVVFSTNVGITGAAVLQHTASSKAGESLDPFQESARFLTTDFGIGELTDFSTPFTIASDRTFTLEDGTTTMAGYQIKYVTTGIDGIAAAMSLDTSLSEIHLRAVCTQMDLLVVNSSAMTAYISIDGCPDITYAIAGSGLYRLPVLRNARYQTHEIAITNSAGLSIAGIILHEPTVDQKVEGSLLATQNLVARYVQSRQLGGNIIPTGGVAVNPHVSGAVFVNGTGTGNDWTTQLSFTENPIFGRYSSSDREGSYVEFTFFGGGVEVEYWADFNRGKPIVFLNSVIANTTNFVGATFSGIDGSTGEVDMYSSVKTRKRFLISSLTESRYTIRIQVKTPRKKNAASSGFSINISSFYLLNTGGSLSVTPSRGYSQDDFVIGLDSARDERNFDSGAIVREQIPVIRTVTVPSRSQRVGLSNGSTTVSVVFSTSLDSSDYAVSCNLYNTTDATPFYQPITVTNVTSAGFTAKWNDPLDSANYYLSYTALLFS